MEADEQQIRELVSTWMAATKAGDVEKVLSLMSDDVVFLMPGRPPMRKADFAAAGAQAGTNTLKFDGTSEIQEIRVISDWAFMWSKLTVVVTSHSGPPTKRAGHTLSVLKKHDGKWRLARDANMLVSVSS